MNYLLRSTLVAAAMVASAAAAAPEATPVPKVTGPIPVTADSFPFLAANRNLQPMDLAKLGYVEEEFIVSGTANVYDWAADGAVSVKTPNAPYATRILVRRPADAARFSGTVVVELMNPARRFDWPMMWGFSHDYFVDHGDAWVGITLPGSVQALKKFNPSRYAELSFANPNPGAVCAGGGRGRGRGGRGGGSPDSEDGLRWDMISQVAAALKSDARPGPMAGFKVQYAFMTTQTGDIVTYINAIHPHANLENGKPAYDGYLIKNPPRAASINQCTAAPGQGDPRQLVGNASVPVVSVVAQGEVLASAASRRPDSDEANGRYRLYEIAGVAHIDRNAYVSFPSFADQIAAVGAAQGTPSWPFNVRCDPEIPLSDRPLLKYSYNAAFANLDRWVRKGTPPPKAERIEVKDAGTPQASLVLDKFGNGAGGVRNPYVDVPVATYYTSSPGPGTCAELGHDAPFDWARLEALYGNYKDYARKVAQSADRMVKEHYLTEADAKRIKAEMVAPLPTPRTSGGGSN